MELIDKIEAYWTGRAERYSEVNQGELATDQKQKWTENLKKHLPKGEPKKHQNSGCRNRTRIFRNPSGRRRVSGNGSGL